MIFFSVFSIMAPSRKINRRKTMKKKPMKHGKKIVKKSRKTYKKKGGLFDSKKVLKVGYYPQESKEISVNKDNKVGNQYYSKYTFKSQGEPKTIRLYNKKFTLIKLKNEGKGMNPFGKDTYVEEQNYDGNSPIRRINIENFTNTKTVTGRQDGFPIKNASIVDKLKLDQEGKPQNGEWGIIFDDDNTLHKIDVMDEDVPTNTDKAGWLSKFGNYMAKPR